MLIIQDYPKNTRQQKQPKTLKIWRFQVLLPKIMIVKWFGKKLNMLAVAGNHNYKNTHLYINLACLFVCLSVCIQ